jgi:hypothetical protein
MSHLGKSFRTVTEYAMLHNIEMGILNEPFKKPKGTAFCSVRNMPVFCTSANPPNLTVDEIFIYFDIRPSPTPLRSIERIFERVVK